MAITTASLLVFDDTSTYRYWCCCCSGMGRHAAVRVGRHGCCWGLGPWLLLALVCVCSSLRKNKSALIIRSVSVSLESGISLDSTSPSG
jgi:hypothetical protein